MKAQPGELLDGAAAEASAIRPAPNRTKIRLGLALLSVVMIAAVAMLVVVQAAAGKAVMFAIVLTTFLRLSLLVRDLRD